MALRSNTGRSLASAVRLSTGPGMRSTVLRSFSSTYLRQKDVVSEVSTPNMRHAERLRMYTPLAPPTASTNPPSSSNRPITPPNRQPSRQIQRQDQGLTHLRPIPNILSPKIHSAILRLEGRANALHPAVRRHPRHLIPQAPHCRRIHMCRRHHSRRLPHTGSTIRSCL